MARDLQYFAALAPENIQIRSRQSGNGAGVLTEAVCNRRGYEDKETVDSVLAIDDRTARKYGSTLLFEVRERNIGGNLTPEYIEIAKAMADVDVADRPKVLEFARSLARPIELTAHRFPPRKQLEAGQ